MMVSGIMTPSGLVWLRFFVDNFDDDYALFDINLDVKSASGPTRSGMRRSATREIPEGIVVCGHDGGYSTSRIR